MIRLVWFELIKTFSKLRTLLGFLIILIVVPLVEVAMKLEGGHFANAMTRGLQQDFFFVGSLFNGWFVAEQIMMSLWFHFPFLIAFVAGDQLAGEATAGTYRLLLIRPVSRARIFAVKYLVVLFYTFCAVALLAGLSIGLALALFGGGDLFVFGRGIEIIAAAEVPAHFLAAYLFALASMATIASIAFFFSSFVENAIGPIVGTMGVLIVFGLISTIPLDLFSYIKPYLFTTYLDVWRKGLTDPIPWEEVRTSMACMGATAAAVVAGALLVFTRKDILS